MAYSLLFRDIIDHLMDYLGGDAEISSQRDIRRAIKSGYREVSQARKWAYLLDHYRIQLSAPQSSSTITYDHTGGSSERLVTIAAGTWPTWAASGTIKIGSVASLVTRRLSSTTLQLHDDINPGSDVAAGTAYVIFQSSYTLPADFVSLNHTMTEDNWWYSYYIDPELWLAYERFGEGSGTPQGWTIMGDPRNRYRHVLRVYPYPDAAETMDLIYHRRPRDLVYTGHNTNDKKGTVANTAAQITATGTSSVFSSGMVGSTMRISGDPNQPSDNSGLNPYDEEAEIRTFVSATVVTMTKAITNAHSGKAYNISDPVDLPEALVEPFLRCCEKHIAIIRRMDDRMEVEAEYRLAIKRAMDADARVHHARWIGMPSATRWRAMRYWGSGPDES